MTEAYIVEAVRTPTGRRGGGLSQVHPADLGAHVINEVIARNDLDPMAVEDVVFGCVDTLGPQAGDIARTAWLAAGLPEAIPGTTIDRQCGSGQQAVSFAAMGIMSGLQDLVVAGGVQNMSMIPIGLALEAAKPFGHEDPFSGSTGWVGRYGTQEVSQFRGAELIAEKWDISRDEMEDFAFTSHERAITAIDEGRFDLEVSPLAGVEVDEGPRRGGSIDKMAQLPPLVEGGRITAALASQVSDGAAAILVASEKAIDEHGLTPRARIHHISVRGDDPIYMLTGPIAATTYALEKTGMSIDDIDLFECNEAFAPVPMAWMAEHGVPHEKVNVNGGAIALGHPLGCSGAKLMTTLLHELERTGGRGRRPGQRDDPRAPLTGWPPGCPAPVVASPGRPSGRSAHDRVDQPPGQCRGCVDRHAGQAHPGRPLATDPPRHADRAAGTGDEPHGHLGEGERRRFGGLQASGKRRQLGPGSDSWTVDPNGQPVGQPVQPGCGVGRRPDHVRRGGICDRAELGRIATAAEHRPNAGQQDRTTVSGSGERPEGLHEGVAHGRGEGVAEPGAVQHQRHGVAVGVHEDRWFRLIEPDPPPPSLQPAGELVAGLQRAVGRRLQQQPGGRVEALAVAQDLAAGQSGLWCGSHDVGDSGGIEGIGGQHVEGGGGSRGGQPDGDDRQAVQRGGGLRWQ